MITITDYTIRKDRTNSKRVNPVYRPGHGIKILVKGLAISKPPWVCKTLRDLKINLRGRLLLEMFLWEIRYLTLSIILFQDNFKSVFIFF